MQVGSIGNRSCVDQLLGDQDQYESDLLKACILADAAVAASPPEAKNLFMLPATLTAGINKDKESGKTQGVITIPWGINERDEEIAVARQKFACRALAGWQDKVVDESDAMTSVWVVNYTYVVLARGREELDRVVKEFIGIERPYHVVRVGSIIIDPSSGYESGEVIC